MTMMAPRTLTPTIRVLIVEGHQSDWHELEGGLRNQGYEVDTVDDCESVRRQLIDRSPDVIVLDLRRPQPLWDTLFRQVRSLVDAPLLIVSSPEAGIDVAEGLEMGATDVVTTPLRTREVVARVGAVLRRVSPTTSEVETTAEDVLYAGPLAIDRNLRTVVIGDRSVYLRPIEYKLLLLLATSPGRVRTREELTDRLWGDRSPRSNQSLHAQMHNLRAKVEREPSAPVLIKTIKGVGFKLDVGMERPSWPGAN
jgi:two-component system response regulator RegX3